MSELREMSKVFTIAAFAVLIGWGCSRKPEAEPAIGDKEAAESLLGIDPSERLSFEIMGRIEALAMDGKAEEALTLADESLANKDLAAHRAQMFNSLIRILMYTDNQELAKKRMLDVYGNDEELALGAMGLIYGSLIESGDATNAVAWTEDALAVEGLFEDVRRRMREWNLQGYVAVDDGTKVRELALQFVRDAPTGGALGILERVFENLFNNGKLDLLDDIVSQARQVVTSDEGTQNLLLATRMKLQAHRGEWQKVADGLANAIQKLPDSDLQRLLRQIFALANKDGQSETIEIMCTTVIASHDDKEQSFLLAGRQWVELGVRKDPAVLPDRLANLQDKGYPLQHLANLFIHYFYRVIDLPVTADAMKALAVRLAPLVGSDETRNTLKTMVLDASFVSDDYDSALDILRQGIADRDESWHLMAISKVEAHKALKEERPRDAVKHFREFMAAFSAAKDEITSDPVTGVIFSREMILGRNAKRIGDIYKEIPDDEAATKAYAEARGYYQKALAAEQDREAIKIINQELSEVP